MNRKILIISNPGERGNSNYCEGVNIDVKEYSDFFLSPLGGAWVSSEITHLAKPTVAEVRENIQKLSGCDYSLVAFCGHGWFSAGDKSTILELRPGHHIEEFELRRASKRLLILDCCREVHKESIREAMAKALNFSEDRHLDMRECRKYYDEAITKAVKGITVVYACSLRETAGDSSRFGGYYSSSLRRSAADWWEKKRIDVTRGHSVLNITDAHDKACVAVKRLSGGNQNPQIDKPRSEPYLPFAVLV